MIPVPVPVPVPVGYADASAAMSAPIAAAAGQGFHNAFLSSYSRGLPAPLPQAQPPPGFVAPPGFKFVLAPGPMQDTPGYPGSWPSTYMNQGREDFPSSRENSHPNPEMKKTRPTSKASTSKKGNGRGKVFVGGLSPVTTVDMLRDHFAQFGKLIDVSVIKDPVTKESRGFGFVEFEGGIPPKLLELNHVIDKRKCGVKPYTYEAS
jgi:hypothetical protein